jgi:nucleotide-binding universal stress UspA family protein
MKIIIAADGSKYTKKALAFLVNHEGIGGESDELVVLHVQPPLSPRVRAMLGATAVAAYHKEEAAKVLEPIGKFLKRHSFVFKTSWVTGSPAQEVVRLAQKERAHLIVAGTHGHGILGRAVLGSVAQRILTDSEIPVLLVR